MRRLTLGIACLFIVLAFATKPANAALDSRIDRRSIQLGETIELDLVLDQQVLFDSPDFRSLESDFEIISRNRSSQISIVNGKQQALTQWRLTLSPKRTGTLIIPSFNFEGDVSNALEVTVLEPVASTDPGKPIFTETTLDKTTVYVQEQVILTLRLYTLLSLNNYATSELKIPDAQVISLGENQYHKLVAGKNYTVVETRYAVFPEKSGLIQIPAVQYSGNVRTRSGTGSLWLSRNNKRVSVHSEQQELNVQGKPEELATETWLPANSLSISDRWSSEEALTLGEPVTRTITLTGSGVTAAQFPPLSMASNEAFKVYPDQPQLENSTGEDGVTGTRMQSIALVPQKAGTYTLPSIVVHWWDTVSNQPQSAILPAKTVRVLPVPGKTLPDSGEHTETGQSTHSFDSSGEGMVVAKPNAHGTWILALAFSNGLALIAAGVFARLWWRQRRPRLAYADRDRDTAATDASLKERFEAVKDAANSNDLTGLREAVITWARLFWQDHRIHTLDHVARNLDNQEIKAIFSALDNSLYSAVPEIMAAEDLSRLVRNLETAARSPALSDSRQRERDLTTLQPLYPG